MRTPYLVGSIIGTVLVAKATADLSNTFERRKYLYLKCLNDRLSKGMPIEDAKMECEVEAWRQARLPNSVYFIGAVAIIPALALAYETIKMLNSKGRVK